MSFFEDKRFWYGVAALIVLIILIVMLRPHNQNAETPAPVTTSSPATTPEPTPTPAPKQATPPKFGYESQPAGATRINITYYVVIPFDRNEDGDLAAGAAQEATSALAAERGARQLAFQHVGAVAFSRTGDTSIGEFQDAVILVQFGDVDRDALSA